ncbi:MAG TPA: acyl carrier protein [Steroidobacteraceae bacterium]|jgi:acyl carrier protein|nr:acyl carrier protein [Steroidobacteraceae bacterium]
MTTLEQLSKILVKNYKIDPTRLTLDGPLAELGIDSLGMAELLFFIEDEFKVQLPFDPVALPTLGDAICYIDSLLAAQHATEKSTIAGVVPPASPHPPA